MSSIPLMTAQDYVKSERPLEEIAHVLPHRIGSPLIPLRAGGRLLSRKNIYKAARKIVELVAGLNMSMQRHGVELRQQIDRAQPGVQAVADRNINNAILAAERNSRFSAIFCEGEQTRARTAAHDDRQRSLKCPRGQCGRNGC